MYIHVHVHICTCTYTMYMYLYKVRNGQMITLLSRNSKDTFKANNPLMMCLRIKTIMCNDNTISVCLLFVCT